MSKQTISQLDIATAKLCIAIAFVAQPGVDVHRALGPELAEYQKAVAMHTLATLTSAMKKVMASELIDLIAAEARRGLFE